MAGWEFDPAIHKEGRWIAAGRLRQRQIPNHFKAMKAASLNLKKAWRVELCETFPRALDHQATGCNP